MGRLVKFYDTGEKGDKDTGYHAPDGKNYSCKAGYERIANERKYWKMCAEWVTDLFGYQKGMKPNTYIYRLLQELQPYGYEVVYDTLVDQNESILWALNTKFFKNETMKIKYVFAIVNNNILDMYKKKQRDNKAKVVQFKHTEEDNPDIDIGGFKGKGNDVSGFVGDDI